MQISSFVKGLSDYVVIPLALGAISIAASKGLLALDRRIHFFRRVFKDDIKIDREIKVCLLGFGGGFLLSAAVLPRFLPFMQIAPWGQPFFAWNKIEAYLNKA